MSTTKRPSKRGWWRGNPRSASARFRGGELRVEQLERRLVPASALSANALFVEQVYRDVLGRNLDSGGGETWVDQLDAGVSKESVVTSILASPERDRDVVENLYIQFLHRAVDPSGLNSSVNELLEGATPESVAAELVGSPEFSSQPGNSTDTGFLSTLFQDALNRPIDPTGLSYFGAQLAAGVSRSVVASEVLTSTEARENFVESQYLNLLGRASDAAGMAGWVSDLQSGATDNQIIAGFLVSTEYMGVASASAFGAGTFFLQATGPEKGELGDVGRAFTRFNEALGGNSPAAQLATDFASVASDVSSLQQLFAPLLTPDGASIDLGSVDGQEITFNAQSFNEADKLVVSEIDPNDPDDDLSFLNNLLGDVRTNFSPQKVLGDAKNAINAAVSQVASIPIVGDIASAFNQYASALLTVMSAEGETGANVISGNGVLPTQTLTTVVTEQAQQAIDSGVKNLVDKLEEPIGLSEDEQEIREKLISFLEDTMETTSDMDPSNPSSDYSQVLQQQQQIDQKLPDIPVPADPDSNIQVTPPTIELDVTEGEQNPAPVTLQITNDGGAGSELQPTLSTNGSGVASVSQTQPAEVGAGASESVVVNLNTGGVPAGTDYSTLVISDPNSDQGVYVVPVVINVQPETPSPDVSAPAGSSSGAPSASAVTGIAITNISVQGGNTVVNVAVTPAVSGVSVNYSVSGTDGFTTSGTVQTDASGATSFNFTAGAAGVTDTITVQGPDGVNATQMYTY
jgi:hypothetical protein